MLKGQPQKAEVISRRLQDETVDQGSLLRAMFNQEENQIMKKFIVPLLSILILAAMLLPTNAVAYAAPAAKCATIQGGTITDSSGNVLALGFDQFGYNYQAHEFNGTYDGYDRVWGNDSSDYADDQLIMKWSNDWLSNTDCNGDHKLDRGSPDSAGFPASNISQGWETNHFVGDYDSDGNGSQDAQYTDFVKIVWVGPGGSLWGQYEVVQEVYNDPVGGFHGLLSKMPSPGFGLNDHWTQ
jgi:hypothetical protein